MKIGIIKEGKTPPDKRVPLSPVQCKQFMQQWPNVQLVVQKSPIRAYTDAEYLAEGVTMADSVEDCDVLIGVKEVPINELIPNKTYFFFSHTYKKQPYNKKLLQAVLDKQIKLIDYEVLTRKNKSRIIGFGRYAGIVGAYNGLLAWGKKAGTYELKPANQCFDRKEMEAEYAKINLPKNYKIVLTGSGRVGQGAVEVLKAAGVYPVSEQQFLNEEFPYPVYTQLHVNQYYRHPEDPDLSVDFCYAHPELLKSNFGAYAAVSNMYISCHFWDNRAPYIFTREEAKASDFNIKVVADISCDIDCAVASTLRPSTIADPLYGYNAKEEKEVDFMDKDAIGVMAVDNLPCELPRDASTDFGIEMLNEVLPRFLGDDPDEIIHRATQTTLDGKLNEPFTYLQPWLEEA